MSEANATIREHRARSLSRARLTLAVGRRSFLLLLVPGLAVYVAFVIYPFLTSFVYGFYDWNGIGPLDHPVGLGNFRYILFSRDFSSFFYRALLHNLTLFALLLVLTTVLGMVVAYLMTQVSERASRVYQVVYFLPHVIPAVVIAFMAGVYLQPTFGVIPTALRDLHLTFLDQPYLGSETLALPMVAAISAWAALGFAILVFLATLVGLPKDLLQAARLDGANALQVFVWVVFPLIRPTFVTLVILNFIYSFGTFDLIYVLEGTQAGPNYATDVTGTLFYRTAFGGFGTTAENMGLAAALAVVSFLIVMVVSAFLVRLQKRWTVQYA